MDLSLWFAIPAAIVGIVLYWLLKGYRSPRLLRAASEAVENGSPLLDVRTREEFQQGHHPRAVNIPIQELAGNTDRLGDHDRPVVVYCHTGSRSGQAVSVLSGAGYRRVIDLGPMRNTRHISEKMPKLTVGKIPSSRRRRRR